LFSHFHFIFKVYDMTAPVAYIPKYVGRYGVVEDIWKTIPFERRSSPPRVVGEELVLVPRHECWMNEFDMPYAYGKGAGERTYIPVERWPNIAREIQWFLYLEHKVHFEGCFINGYENGRDHLGWHADDSPYIDHTKPIAIVTFGAEREIWFRKNKEPLSDPIYDGFLAEFTTPQPDPVVEKLVLEHGSLCLMAPGMQQTHQHRIPKASSEKGPRISLTYRSLLREPLNASNKAADGSQSLG
jgi:alkylated DNA repair dioxygenase AlkB